MELIHQHIDTEKRNQGLFRSGAGERNYLFILKFSPSFCICLKPLLESFGIMRIFSVVLLLLHALGEFSHLSDKNSEFVMFGFFCSSGQRLHSLRALVRGQIRNFPKLSSVFKMSGYS